MRALNIDVDLVQRLVATQFPQWSHLPISPVATSGWDNRTFHLGDSMSVRLPSAAGYAPAVLKEQTCLPQLAPQLPLPIPQPLRLGQPDASFPWHWSVYRWLPGTSAAQTPIDDRAAFAVDLVGFLNTLHRLDTRHAPAATAPLYRGGSLAL